MAQADGVGIELVDLELVPPAIGGDGVAAIALAGDFEFVGVASDFDLRRQRKRCRQAAAPLP